MTPHRLEIASRRQQYEAHLGQAIFNLRERVFKTSLEALGAGLSRLAGEDSPIWPIEYAGPMVMTPKLEVGAKGGHGGGRISYTCVELTPNVRTMFRFEPGDQDNAMIGVHYLELVPVGEGVVARYVVMAEMRGEAYRTWVTDGLGRRHDAAVDMLFEHYIRFAAGERG